MASPPLQPKSLRFKSLRSGFLWLAVATASVLTQVSPAASDPVECGSSTCYLPDGGATQEKSRWETGIYAGVQWNFGDSTPELTVGLRRTKTLIRDEAYGGKIDIAVPLDFSKTVKPVARVMAVAGTREVQGEAGVGIRAVDWKAVFAAGVQAPFVNGGVNYVVDDGLKPYLGVNSVQRLKAPKTTGGALTCMDGLVLTLVSSLTDLVVPPSKVKGGYTCFSNT